MRVFATVLLGCLLSAVHADAGIKLKAIRFPAVLGANGGSKVPPTAGPLAQTIVFEFDGKPQIGAGIADGLRIRIDGSNGLGQEVGRVAFGDYKVEGNKVLFLPRLPNKALPAGFGPTSDNQSDADLPGLLPDTIYSIDVTVGTTNSVKNLTKIGNVGLPLLFRTVPVLNGEFAISAYYNNAPAKAPVLKGEKIKPKPGTSGLYPNPFEDAAGLFAGIDASKRAPFRLIFAGPLDPTLGNISDANIRLRAIAAPDGTPVDLSINSDVVLTSNDPDKSSVYVYPRGILPLGYTIALQVSDKLKGLAGAVSNPIPGDINFAQVAKYVVATDPTAGDSLDDRIVETFQSNAAQDASVIAEGKQVANWDSGNSDNLRAAFGFGGDGSLGRFLAPNEAITINLDTNFQQFPLFSGSTPDVPAGVSVKGGVFHFTDFHLPAKATLRLRGINTAVITCTGTMLIEGKIDLNGANGTKDDTFDSAITPTAGGSPGAGGGKGGDSHPVTVPLGASSLKFIQTPHFGQTGFGSHNTPGGGAGGGQAGCSLPWIGFLNSTTCANFGATGDGSRGSGGGGGSLNTYFPTADGAQDPTVRISGRRGAIGVGNHLPVDFDATKPIAQEPTTYNASPGNPENALARVNPNPTFTQAYKDGLIWDKGIMAVDASVWAQTHKITFGGTPGPPVFIDSDPNNDFIGGAGELPGLIGGQGGGGSGSRTEGSTFACKAPIFDGSSLPFTVNDAKGGGGGGGGGGLLIQAIGTVSFVGPSARIEAKGGNGAGGEQTGASSRGGSGGGGSGGVVIIQSATDIRLNDGGLMTTVIDVSAGCGHDATTLPGSTGTGLPGGDAAVIQFGDGSPGGPGLVQLHSPSYANVVTTKVGGNYFPTALAIQCSTAGFKPYNPLVPTSKTPTPLDSKSTARSVWYDLGSVTSDFRPLVATNAGMLEGPIFGVPGTGPFFKGTDVATGNVLTDASGFVIDPFANDIEVDAPDLLIADHIPQAAPYFQSVRVTFQGADEDMDNPGSPDLSTATAFVPDVTELNGRRFLRWEITFDIATNSSFPAQPTTPRPQVNLLRIPFKY